jgi:hypothetical protein
MVTIGDILHHHKIARGYAGKHIFAAAPRSFLTLREFVSILLPSLNDTEIKFLSVAPALP